MILQPEQKPPGEQMSNSVSDRKRAVKTQPASHTSPPHLTLCLDFSLMLTCCYQIFQQVSVVPHAEDREENTEAQ
ncbi:hypothetical protein INR49_016387 [Caranx melampygus]|nr:hypothetical protein INR49_016387 [Caranx melampygus]